MKAERGKESQDKSERTKSWGESQEESELREVAKSLLRSFSLWTVEDVVRPD